VNTRLVHRTIDAAAEAGVRNSQPEGIGRVVTLADFVCWNNLGRNVVFADRALRPRAVFGTTLYPDDDEASQYDLDIHSILDIPEFGLVVVLNHFGAVRAFRRTDLLESPQGTLVTPSAVWWAAADVERTIAAAGRLVSSAPRSDGAIGLLVSDPLGPLADGSTVPATSMATSFGEVTALGLVSSSTDSLLALGGDDRLGLFPLISGRVGRPRWEVAVGFRVMAVASHEGAVLAAGPDGGPGVDDYDWESLRGGHFAAFDPADGATITSGSLPDGVAWGTGGVAVAPFDSGLAVAGRSGCIHLVDPRSGAVRRSTMPLGGTSLGIAHLAVVGRRVLCGFNRGGYRLHSFAEVDGDADAP